MNPHQRTANGSPIDLKRKGEKSHRQGVKVDLEDLRNVPESPESGIWMKVCFPLSLLYEWLTSIAWAGMGRTFRFEELPKLAKSRRVESYEARFDEGWNKLKGVPCGLFLTIQYCFGLRFWLAFILMIAGMMGYAFQPRLMMEILSRLLPKMDTDSGLLMDQATQILPLSLRPDPSLLFRSNDWEIWIWVVLLALCSLLSEFLIQWSWALTIMIGMQTRSILLAKIFQKSLRLSHEGSTKYPSGTIMNYVTKDMLRIERVQQFIHYGSGSLVFFGVTLYYLIDLIDWASLAGFGSVIGLAPLLCVFAALYVGGQQVIMRHSDIRASRTNEVLQGIRVIKFFAWEEAYENMVTMIRDKEISGFRFLAIVNSGFMGIFLCTPMLIAVVSFSTYYAVHGHLTPSIVFTAFAYFSLLQLPIGMGSWVLTTMVEYFDSLRRISVFLLAPEIGESEFLADGSSGAPDTAIESEDVGIGVVVEPTGEFAVEIVNGHFRWPAIAGEGGQKKEGVGEKETSEKTEVIDASGNDQEEAEVEMEDLGGSQSVSVSPKEDCESDEEEEEEEEEEEGENSSEVGTEGEEEDDFWELTDVNVRIPKGSLTMIIGPVGSGKSSLLQACLGEMPCWSNLTRTEINGCVGYCAQHPWIMNATLLDNVTFGKPLDEGKFEEIVNVCSLVEDLRVLKGGRMIEIGEKGINLSGGQKYRVSLARACYSENDVLLLDDPLAAVDAHVGQALMSDCLLGYLRNKTRVLVTHHLHFLHHADHIIMMEKGKIVEQGSYQELMASEGSQTFAFVNKFVGEKEDEKISSLHVDQAAGANEANQAQKQETDDETSLMTDEASATGTVSLGVCKAYCVAGGGAIALILLLLSYAFAQGVVTSNDWWLSAWSDQTYSQLLGKGYNSTVVQRNNSLTGDISFFYYNISEFAGGCPLPGTSNVGEEDLLSLGICDTMLVDVEWDEAYNNGTIIESGLTMMQSVYVYLGIGVVAFVFGFVREFCLGIFALNASKNLHNQALVRILRAPVSFFDTTPLGRIMNRFGNDISVLDYQMVEALSISLSMAFMCLEYLFMMAYATNGVFAIVLIPALAVYFGVWLCYRRFAVQLKRMESVAKSPLLAHVSETLAGTATIRAYKRTEDFHEKNRFLVNLAQRPFFLIASAQRWIEMRLALMGRFLIFAVSGVSVLLYYYAPASWNISVSSVALGITYSFVFSMSVGFLLQQITVVEGILNSADRLNEYASEIPTEADARLPTDPSNDEWPPEGSITLTDFSMRYREGLPLVLKELSFRILPSEKLGVVGRTGSGKSSLLLALFRFVESASGSIEIDSRDISKIGTATLRKAIAIIPQDPVLFAGTIRSNLDPFDDYSDSDLWVALEKSFMKEKVSEQSPLGLSAPMAEGGENFSVGERQLFCLARALLRKAKILCFDECTSSVDLEKDKLIQETIRTAFADCTTLTIAHRLDTVVDSDRILVLDQGVVAELDTPSELLLNEKYHEFRDLVMETGEGHSELLFTQITGEGVPSKFRSKLSKSSYTDDVEYEFVTVFEESAGSSRKKKMESDE